MISFKYVHILNQGEITLKAILQATQSLVTIFNKYGTSVPENSFEKCKRTFLANKIKMPAMSGA